MHPTACAVKPTVPACFRLDAEQFSLQELPRHVSLLLQADEMKTTHTTWRSTMQAVHAGAEQSPAWKWRYILSGGSPPVDQALTAGAGDILVTGHRDGRVRLWDACAEVRFADRRWQRRWQP